MAGGLHDRSRAAAEPVVLCAAVVAGGAENGIKTSVSYRRRVAGATMDASSGEAQYWRQRIIVRPARSAPARYTSLHYATASRQRRNL